MHRWRDIQNKSYKYLEYEEEGSTDRWKYFQFLFQKQKSFKSHPFNNEEVLILAESTLNDKEEPLNDDVSTAEVWRATH